jgi:hypothetical protein
MTKFINSEQYLEKMLKDKKKHIQIIALFSKIKNYHFENYEQIQRFIKRNTRAAKELDCYSLDKIEQVAKYLDKTANYKWTIESIIKHVDEDINRLTGEEPIITLKNGEQIYEISKLRELERANKIFWSGHKWLER